MMLFVNLAYKGTYCYTLGSSFVSQGLWIRLIVSTFSYYYVLLLRSLPLKITYCYTPGNPCVPHKHWDRLILLILNYNYINGL
jgi:hypothetical protein